MVKLTHHRSKKHCIAEGGPGGMEVSNPGSTEVEKLEENEANTSHSDESIN